MKQIQVRLPASNKLVGVMHTRKGMKVDYVARFVAQIALKFGISALALMVVVK
jgi:hypothetical protein